MRATCKLKTKTSDRKIIANISSVWANTSTCSEKSGKLNCKMVLKEKIDSICSAPKEYVQFKSEPVVNAGPKKCEIPENYISMLTGKLFVKIKVT